MHITERYILLHVHRLCTYVHTPSSDTKRSTLFCKSWCSFLFLPPPFKKKKPLVQAPQPLLWTLPLQKVWATQLLVWALGRFWESHLVPFLPLLSWCFASPAYAFLLRCSGGERKCGKSPRWAGERARGSQHGRIYDCVLAGHFATMQQSVSCMIIESLRCWCPD